MDETSLDDFLEAEADDDTLDERERKRSETDKATAVAIATYSWTPGGIDCGSCGRMVERRWRDGGTFVCAECKVW